MTQSNQRLIERYYEELWNRWNPEAIEEIIAPDIVFRGSLGVSVAGKQEFARYVDKVRTAFPDFHNQIEDLFADDAKVAARLTYTGTHRGELFGMRPTGARVSYGGVALFRVREGQIAEGHVLGDVPALNRQIEEAGGFATGVIIASKTLRLRATADADLDFVLALESAADNSPFVGQWSREEHRAAIRSADMAHLIIETADERPVGYAIVTGVRNPHGSVCLQRIVIGEKGRGFGREALRLIAPFAFEQCGAHRLWLDVKAGNARAKGLYESVGFAVEGLLRDSFRSGEQYDSQYVLSMLRADYERATATSGAST
jgi:steroid delta-isomerase-like uncharacterized protein